MPPGVFACVPELWQTPQNGTLNENVSTPLLHSESKGYEHCEGAFWSGLVWSGLVWSGLVWSSLFCSVLFCSVLVCSVLFCSVLF